jgi:hypothetical protein
MKSGEIRFLVLILSNAIKPILIKELFQGDVPIFYPGQNHWVLLIRNIEKGYISVKFFHADDKIFIIEAAY